MVWKTTLLLHEGSGFGHFVCPKKGTPRNKDANYKDNAPNHPTPVVASIQKTHGVNMWKLGETRQVDCEAAPNAMPSISTISQWLVGRRGVAGESCEGRLQKGEPMLIWQIF